MEIEQTTGRGGAPAALALPRLWEQRTRYQVHLGYALFRVVFLTAALFLSGAGAIPAHQARTYSFGVAVAGWSFDLIRWEVDALRGKASALLQQPARMVDAPGATRLVRDYLARAHRIGALERELLWRAGQEAGYTPPRPRPGEPPTIFNMDTWLLEGQLAVLRSTQDQVRPAVEQVIERQVTEALLEAGFGVGGTIWPPVQFTFTEPPQKLVVSPRDRIATVYSRMLVPELPLDEVERAEQTIGTQPNAVAYITQIGGLGAYPAMVVDRAGLRWVLSTVAHEWVHNYLTFFPLGFNYFRSPELMALNETVAEIVGNEIGDHIYVRVYGGEIPRPAAEDGASPDPDDEVFDFRREMRATRLEVDRLLALGDVAGAEAYMETRRREFVANGYSIRVLNQAYFAFHGSYGTSPASSSPIGPAMAQLRDLSPDLPAFMQTVRGFTSPDDLAQALIARGVEVDW